MVYLTMLSITKATALNGRMIGKDVEGSCHRLIQGTIKAFIWDKLKDP
jgi:hypothetical protein